MYETPQRQYLGHNAPLGYYTNQSPPLRCFLCLLPNYIHGKAVIMQSSLYLDKREVLQQEYSQPPILPSPHFRLVVKWLYNLMGGLEIANLRIINIHIKKIIPPY